MRIDKIAIVQLERTEAFGNYRYQVWIDSNLIAEIEHMYRGDERYMRRPEGRREATDRTFDGGGPETLRLSASGLRDLKRIAGA